MSEIVLASASPRRRALLDQIGVAYEVCPAHVDERTEAGEDPEAYASRMAWAKAQAGWAREGSGRERPVLGADTVVVLEHEAMGKPRDRDEGLAMLARLSGRCHQVISAVALATQTGIEGAVSSTQVCLRTLSEGERQAYWASGEPSDKAGAYAIQGLGAIFVERIEGSYSGVMGLPLCETARLLEVIGYPLLGAASGPERQDCHE